MECFKNEMIKLTPLILSVVLIGCSPPEQKTAVNKLSDFKETLGI